MATKIWVNIGSGNGLVPTGIKPLPEPMLSFHQCGPVTFIWGQLFKRYISYLSVNLGWKLLNGNIKFSFKSPSGQQVRECCCHCLCPCVSVKPLQTYPGQLPSGDLSNSYQRKPTATSTTVSTLENGIQILVASYPKFHIHRAANQ